MCTLPALYISLGGPIGIIATNFSLSDGTPCLKVSFTGTSCDVHFPGPPYSTVGAAGPQWNMEGQEQRSGYSFRNAAVRGLLVLSLPCSVGLLRGKDSFHALLTPLCAWYGMAWHGVYGCCCVADEHDNEHDVDGPPEGVVQRAGFLPALHRWLLRGKHCYHALLT